MGTKDYNREHPRSEYMQEALALAQKAFTLNEVPIGAVVVDSDGTCIGRGYNQVEKFHQQSAHAEVIAINEASAQRADWRLQACWLYVTLEPCTMCMMLAKLSRIEGIIYGADSPLFGYHLDNKDAVPLYKKKPFTIVGGIMKEESVSILKNFFQQKRKKS